MSKVVILDFGIFLHRAGYAAKFNPMPVGHTILNMMATALMKIGIEPWDTIIVACDGRNSWRKDVDTAYKGNRGDQKEKSGLNWDNIYSQGDLTLERIEKGTSWHIIHIDRMEADDIMAVGSRYFKDREVVLVTYDEDLEQCWLYPNVKIWSIMRKMKGGKGMYKIPKKNFNVYKLIAKKVRKEKSDNLVKDIKTTEDYTQRNMIVNLLELPEFVEAPILMKLENLKKDAPDLNCIPFEKLREKIGSLYNDHSKVITYEMCVTKEEKNKEKKKKADRIKRAKKLALKNKKE